MKNRLGFTKSLKFKLTVWYSLILSIFSVIFVLAINIWITNYMNTWTSDISPFGRGFFVERMDRPRLRALSEEQIQIVMESRMKDLENIREISIYMVIPMVLLSFGGGYLLAFIMLRPLDMLNREIKKKEADNLNEQIQYQDKGDEISELISSFNRMSERLSKAFQSQKHFVENASHEIKTPLSLIQANIDTILEDSKITKKKTKELLNNSKKHIAMLDDLTEDLLLLSSMKSSINGKVELMDTIQVLKEIFNTLEGMAKQKGISLILKNEEKKVQIKGNRILITRALNNIVENAIKYSGGSKILVNVRKTNKMVKIDIEDNGKGIPKSERDNVFERFYRIDKGRSRKEGGSGLGLAIAREVVENYGGRLTLDTKNSKGSKFVITFPKL